MRMPAYGQRRDSFVRSSIVPVAAHFFLNSESQFSTSVMTVFD